MELGALVCSPVSPACDQCPVAKQCRAHRDGTQETIPLRKPPQRVKQVREAAIAIRRRGQLLLGRRPPDAARWQNLWEVPHGELAAGETEAQAAKRIAQELTGLEVKVGKAVAAIRHTVTRHAIALTCFEANVTAGRLRLSFYSELRWLSPADLVKYPMSSPQRKMLAAIME